jgi:hypothetical protein
VADYNVQDLIDEVLDLAKDSTLPRSRVLSYLQRTQDAVLGRHRYKFSEGRVTATLDSQATTYAFDEDHQQIIQVVLNHADLGSPSLPDYLPPTDFFDRFPLPDTETAGLPNYYTDYGGELYWNRPLDKAYTFGMRYIKASPLLVDSDAAVPTIPESFKDIYIKGGLAGVEQYRENFDVAAVYQREVEDLTEDLLGRYGLRKMQPGKARTTRRRRTEW